MDVVAMAAGGMRDCRKPGAAAADVRWSTFYYHSSPDGPRGAIVLPANGSENGSTDVGRP